MMNLQGA
jgi:hypothetical protein